MTRRRPPGVLARAWPQGRRGLLACGAAGLALWALLNWGYHVARQPAELVSLVSPGEPTPPRSTWARYGHLFRTHATGVIPPALLAALAQAESDGRPHARPPWRWRWTWHPFEVYAPASSAVGLYQMTDAAFGEARRYCVHGHEVARAGPWTDLRACWLNGLYTRLWPSHAVELTAARLHVLVLDVLGPERRGRASPAQRRDLAAVIHLCGRERALAFVRRGHRPAPGEACGPHDLARYLGRVRGLVREFAALGAPV